jgi:type III restriction enzyme
MATGTGKTVVMACLILYHYLNRREYRNDTRYVDYFLILAPGITIRDRLNVLLPDQQQRHARQPPATTTSSARWCRRPPARPRRTAHRLIITNFHEFLPRLGGNKRTPFDGKLGADGHKVETARTKTRCCGACSAASRPDAGCW